MEKKFNFREKARTTLANARSAATVAIEKFLENPESLADRQRQQSLAEARRTALEKPDFDTLATNLEYQKWAKNEQTPEPYELFEAVKTGKEYNKYMYDAWKEKVIDPALPETDLHQKCVEYCAGTAQAFVDKATYIAEAFASGAQPAEVENMTNAISVLIGTSTRDEKTTIFKDQRWSVSDYRPDYMLLGVDPSELNVPQEKVMAGIGLCVGLWVRLADERATRPVSGHSFAPALKHCSFSSLASESGYTKFANIDTLFLGAHSEAYTSQESDKQQQLFESFRDPQFFANTLAVLRSSDE